MKGPAVSHCIYQLFILLQLKLALNSLIQASFKSVTAGESQMPFQVH